MTTFPAIRIRKDHFSGLGKVATTDKDGLAAILRSMSIDLNRTKLVTTKIADFTADNSGGTVSSQPYWLQDLQIPTAPFDATSAGGASRANFNTATGVMENELAVVADWVNRGRARIGMVPITWADGTIATVGTIPVATAAVSTANGTNAVDYAEGVARLNTVKNNMDTLAQALNSFLAGIGWIPLASNGSFGITSGTYNSTTGAVVLTMASPGPNLLPGNSFNLTGLTGTGAFAGINGAYVAATGTNGTTVNFTAPAGLGASTITGGSLNIPALPSQAGGPITGLITRTAATQAFAMLAVAAAAASATGASSIALAYVTTFQQVFKNNIATMAAAYNQAVLGITSLANLTDSTGASASTAYPLVMAALDSILPTVGVVGAATVNTPTIGMNAQFVIYANALASLNARLAILQSVFGLQTFVDSTGGTPTTTLAALSATTTAVDGSTSGGLDFTSGIAAFKSIENSMATLTAGINAVYARLGIKAITDSTGGVASAAAVPTLAVITAGVDGAAAPALSQFTNTVTNSWLAIARANIATLAAALAVVTGTDAVLIPPNETTPLY